MQATPTPHLIESQLVRFMSDGKETRPRNLRPDTVILVGNGAVENGWEPLLAAFAKRPWLSLDGWKREQYFQSKKFAAHALGTQSFMYRAFRNSIVKKLKAGSLTADYLKNCLASLKDFTAMREEIGTCFNEAKKSQSITLHKEIDLIKAECKSGTVGIITLNWDELLWDRPDEFQNLCQLHGRASHPRSLLFPTELIADEDFVESTDLEALKRAPKANGIDAAEVAEGLKQYAMRQEDGSHLALAHDSAVHWLSSAKKLIVWGVGFNIYDAELHATMGAANNPDEAFESIKVIDIDKEKKDLAGRICMFPIEKIEFQAVST